MRVAPALDRFARPACAVGIALATASLSAFLLEASLHAVSGNSDSATVVLEGAAMSHGHLGLHGWSLTADSFWSVDALFYAAATATVGVRAVLMNAVPSVIAALTIVAGAFIAATGLNRRGSITSSVFVVGFLALPGPVLAYFLLQGPWHVGTTLWCLLAFYALTRPPTRLNFLVGVALLAAGILGDPMALVIGCVPILVCGLIGTTTEERSTSWRSVLAVGTSVAASLVIRTVAYAFGGFAMVSRHDTLRGSQIAWNLSHLAANLGALAGVNSLATGTPPAPEIFHVVRLIAAIVILIGVVTAFVRFIVNAIPRRTPRYRSQRIDDLLVIAFVADLITYVVVSPGPAVNNVRYLIPAAILGTLIGARFIGRALESLHSRRGLVAVGLATLVAIASSAMGTVDLLRSARPVRVGATLTAYLEHQGLTEGIGDYWSSSIVTVDSRERVVVRPVIADLGGRIVRDDRQSDASWYSKHRFEFLVYNTVGARAGVGLGSAKETFGTPARIYKIGTYRLLEWDHPLRVSPALAAQTGALRGFWEP